MLARAIFEMAQRGMEEAERRGCLDMKRWPPIMVYAYACGVCHGAVGAAIMLTIIAIAFWLFIWLV